MWRLKVGCLWFLAAMHNISSGFQISFWLVSFETKRSDLGCGQKYPDDMSFVQFFFFCKIHVKSVSFGCFKSISRNLEEESCLRLIKTKFQLFSFMNIFFNCICWFPVFYLVKSQRCHLPGCFWTLLASNCSLLLWRWCVLFPSRTWTLCTLCQKYQRQEIPVADWQEIHLNWRNLRRKRQQLNTEISRRSIRATSQQSQVESYISVNETLVDCVFNIYKVHFCDSYLSIRQRIQ